MAQRFTREFEEEAVRLVRMSGRTKREIAADLGLGLSTLTRWLARSRERVMEVPERPPPGEDVSAELKRLRRENEILRQERDILKKAPAFRQGGKSLRFELIDAAPTTATSCIFRSLDVRFLNATPASPVRWRSSPPLRQFLGPARYWCS